jgi:signal transduction histidine kinase
MPLESRVTSLVAWLLAAVLVSIGGFIVLRIHHVVRGGEERLLDRVAVVASATRGQLPRLAGVELAVVSRDGRVRSGRVPASIVRELPSLLARAGAGAVYRHDGQTVALRPTQRGGGGFVVAASHLPVADQRRLVAVEAEGLVPIGLVALGLAVIFFERAARRHRRRIERLGRVAARLDRGELDARTGEQVGDELGGVGVQLDVLAGRLQMLERSRGTMLSQVSHDLRSPLALIRAYAWMLRKEEHSKTRSDRLQTIEEEAERVSSLVDDLLLLGRRSAADTREETSDAADIGELARQVVGRRVAQARDAGLALALEPPSSPALVAIRAGGVERIVGNLVDNALRHATRQITVRVAIVGDDVLLSCEDDGPGIPEDELVHLFEPFWRGVAGPGGSGLGLTITRELAASCGGDVHAENVAAGGARLVVRLPRTAQLVGGAM